MLEYLCEFRHHMRNQSQNSEVTSNFPLQTSRADKYFSILLAYYRDITVQYAGKTAADYPSNFFDLVSENYAEL